MNILILYPLLLAVLPLNILVFSIYLCNHPLQWKKLTGLFAVIVFILAYCYVPKGNPDIIAYYKELDDIKGFSISEISMYFQDGLFVEHIYLWLISSIGLYRLEQAITTTIVYFIAYYITFDYYSDNQAIYCSHDIKKVFIIQILLLPFFSIVNNVRNICCFSLIMLASYLDLYKRKRSVGVFVLYFLACFFHSTGIVLVALRLVLLLLKKHRIFELVFLFLIVVATLFYPIVLELLDTITIEASGGILDHIKIFVAKAHWYVDQSTDYYKELSMDVYSTICRVIAFLGSSVVLFSFNSNKYHNGSKQFVMYLRLISAFCIAACILFKAPNYWRFFTALIIGFCPFMLNFTHNSKNRLIIEVLFAFVAICFFVLHIIWSRHITDYNKMIILLFKNNPYTIVIDAFNLLST